MNQLHIVAFDVPYPANYGGVIDVFYRLRALHQAGWKITLHCFTYGGKNQQSELEKYCVAVYYYPRLKLPRTIWKPYITATRNHPDLLKNLLKDDAPILFEALHSCYFLSHPALKGRRKLVRMHNIEHDYYSLLGKSEHNPLKKLYYVLESLLLDRYERHLHHADFILAISDKDEQDLYARFGAKVKLLPPAHANVAITAKPGKGSYCFYHGKLSVAENHVAALYLIKEVFSKTKTPLWIAGDKFSNELKKAAGKLSNVKLLEHLSPSEIDDHISNAHINVLTTFQPTGIKLKLVNVLYQGRFILTNSMMVSGTGLELLVETADTPKQMAEAIERIMGQEFTEEMSEQRSKLLGDRLSLQRQSDLLSVWLNQPL